MEFLISLGGTIYLEDVVLNLISKDFARFYTKLDEFLALDPETLEISTNEKRKLHEEINYLKTLPLNLSSIVFSSDTLHFMVHYKSIMIGNKPECELKIPYQNEFSVVIKYIPPYYYIDPDEDSPVYRKLIHEEEFTIYPGNIFKVGKIEFLASRFNVGRWSHIGKRPHMEDAEMVCHNLFVYESLPIAFYAVYDGHGGSQCSQFLKKHLHTALRTSLLENPANQTNVIGCIKSSIVSTFEAIDKKFSEEFSTLCNVVGSVAIVCLIIGDRIITANLGDSRAVLCRAGKAIELSVDHKPDSKTELERILKNGGSVMLGRIHSKLSVSRAFGDFEYKVGNYGALLSIVPDITQIFINPVEDEFLVVACDGFFEAYKSQEVVTLIRERLAAMPPTEQDPNRVIRELVNEAVFENKTNDNVTALLITLSSGIVI